MNAAELTDKLALHSLRHRNWYIQATCATTGDGLYEGLDWLSSQLRNAKWSITASSVRCFGRLHWSWSHTLLFFFPSLFFLKRRTFWLVLPCICTVCVCLSIFGWTDERLCMYVWAKSEQPCCALNTVSSQDISFLQCQHIQRHWFPQSREQHNIIAVGHLSRMFRITKTKR